VSETHYMSCTEENVRFDCPRRECSCVVSRLEQSNPVDFAQARHFTAINYTAIGSVLRDVILPPLTFSVVLVRAGHLLLILAVWVAIGLMIALSLTRLGIHLSVAVAVGVMTPTVFLILLNIFGVFSNRKINHKQTRQFRKWLSSPAGQRAGLIAAHIVNVNLDEMQALRLTVAEAWLQQSCEKRTLDLSYWCWLWSCCIDDYGAVRIGGRDSRGLEVGGTSTQCSNEIWVQCGRPE